MVDLENILFESAYFKWNRLSLDAMHSDINQDERARTDIEADGAYEKSREIKKKVTEEYKELVQFILKEDIFSVFSENELECIERRFAEISS